MRLNVSRSNVEDVKETNVSSLGASYTHISSLKGIIGPNTKRVVMYHAFLTGLDGLENCLELDDVYLGFNRISRFSPASYPRIKVLDLCGNPIYSLKNCPPCDTLIVSGTRIANLMDCPEGVRIIRCGHSSYLTSLQGCPSSAILIECSCAPNLVIESDHLPKGIEEVITDIFSAG